jgi:LmbE family N-acetylglucosaminyl deacetylase
MRNIALCVLILALLVPFAASAQLEPIDEDRGATGLVLALRKLGSGATFLETTAHPDDEDNGLLVLLSRGRGLRTALLTVTRGDGGQNMIGPEIFEAIGILRAAELMAMHRVDNVEQYFTRAYEFGYSFSVEETLEKWGKDEILADVVRIIRTVRPDVVACMFLTGEGGGQHHQTTARLTKEAFRAAADPNRFPEQIAEGLRPWQPLKLYSHMGIGMGSGRRGQDEPDPPGTVVIDTGVFDPVLGRSYYQMGQEARANHRCQSMSQLRGLPGERLSRWQPVDSVLPTSDTERDLFDGVETGLDRFKDFVRGEQDAAFFLSGLEALKSHVAAAGDAFDSHELWRTIPHLSAGLVAVRELRERTAASALSEQARYEIEHRLAVKEDQFRHALTLAHGVGFDPIADQGEVVPGGVFKVGIRVTHQNPELVEIQNVELGLPEGWNQSLRDGSSSGRLSANDTLDASYEVTVANDAESSRPYWVRNQEVDRFDLIEPELVGLPFTPPVVIAKLSLRSRDVEWTVEEPVQYRYEGPWVGTEKQKRISVLPALSLNLSPRVLVYPTGVSNRSRVVSVNVLHKGNEAVEASLRLEVPEGWSVEPSEAPLVFGRVNEATSVPFEVTAPESVGPGSYEIEAVASIGNREYREGYRTIAYHHIETRYIYRPARVEVQALEIEVEPVTVGYVMGVGDDVPEAIRQLGAEVVMLDEQELAEGDLSRFDLIMTGIRAYLNREDLRAYNHRLLSYVEGGGTVIVQYNKFEFNDAQWGPYPIQVSRNRVTVEEAPMRILEPSHPVFNFPNKITEADWEGWVQERGTYFIGDRDERYRDLLASEDPWEYNAGEKRGILVEVRHGEGRWLYTGLGFYRQLPAGVPDAYKFFANLLSMAKAPPESYE